MSINTKMNKQIVVWLHFNENEKTKTKLEHKDKSHKYLDELRNQNSKGYTQYMINLQVLK